MLEYGLYKGVDSFSLQYSTALTTVFCLGQRVLWFVGNMSSYILSYQLLTEEKKLSKGTLYHP